MNTQISFLLLGVVAALFCAPVAAQQDADSLYQQGISTYNIGTKSSNLDDRIRYLTAAGATLDAFLARYPNHVKVSEAEYYRAICYYHTGDFANAKRVFSAIIASQRKGPYVAAAASVLAQDAFEKKDYDTAARLFAKLSANAIKTADRHRGIYFEALCHHYKKHEKEALRCYELILADPEAAISPYLHLCRKAVGVLRMNADDLQNALDIFQQLQNSQAPDEYRAEAALYSGVCCIKMEDELNAERHFRSVLENNSPAWTTFHPDALTYTMQMRFNKGDFAHVIDLYRANPLNTNDIRQARRSHIVARSMMHLQRYLDAIPLFLEVQKLAEDDPIVFDASYYRLYCFYKLDGKNIVQQVDAFTEIYGKSHKTHPRIHSALSMKAGALEAEGKLKEAAESYNLIDATLLSENSQPNLLYNRAWCLNAVNDFQGAIRSLSKFIEQFSSDKRSTEALALRGDCYLRSGDRDAALKDFSDLIALNAGPKLNAYALQKTAIAKKENKDFDGMIANYKKLLESSPSLDTPTKANANYWIGYGYDKIQQSKNAIPFLEQARKLDAKTYKKNASLTLINCHFELENIDALCAEIDLSIENGYSHLLSPALVSWAGLQSLSLNKSEQAARFFLLISNPTEPRSTPRDVWRNLSKALLINKDYKGSLKALDHFLAVEDNPQAKASALLDQAQCHLKLSNKSQAKKSLDSAFELQPQGIMKTEGQLLYGDYYMADNQPGRARELFLENVKILEDQRLKPLAYHKLISALEATNESNLATTYRQQLKSEFPNWTPPE